VHRHGVPIASVSFSSMNTPAVPYLFALTLRQVAPPDADDRAR
jgi:hypothetical protein